MNYDELIQQARDEISKLDEVLKPLQDQRSELIKELQKLIEQEQLNREHYLSSDEERVLFYLDTRNHSRSQQIFERSNEFFAKYTPTLMFFGYREQTNQRMYTIMVDQSRENIPAIISDIEKINPYLIPENTWIHKREKDKLFNVIPFQVMEYTCSENDCLSGYYDIDNKVWLLSSLYNGIVIREKDLSTFLNKMVDYGAWYNGTEEEEDGDYNWGS